MYCKCISNSLMTFHGTVFLTLNLPSQKLMIFDAASKQVYIHISDKDRNY